MSVILTVLDDHSAYLNEPYIARAGEMAVSLTVNVSAGIVAIGNPAYLDFRQADGTQFYKGPYDCSTGTFGVTLGGTDTVLEVDGILLLQFVLRDALPPTGAEVWKSEIVKTKVDASVNATVHASIQIVPPMTVPTTFPAENTTLTDAGGIIVAENVEDALQEIVGTATTRNNLVLRTTTNLDLEFDIGSVIVAPSVTGNPRGAVGSVSALIQPVLADLSAGNQIAFDAHSGDVAYTTIWKRSWWTTGGVVSFSTWRMFRSLNTTSYVWNPSSIASGASAESGDITITSGVYSDIVLVSAPQSLLGCIVSGYVRTSTTARIVIQNLSGSAVDFGEATWLLHRIRTVA